MLTHGIPPDFHGVWRPFVWRPFVYLNRHTPLGWSRVYRVTQLRADGVNRRESAGTGPVVLQVVPETGVAFASPWTDYCAPLFSHTNCWNEVSMLKVSELCPALKTTLPVRYSFFSTHCVTIFPGITWRPHYLSGLNSGVSPLYSSNG